MKKKINIIILILLFFVIVFTLGVKDIKSGRLSSYGKYVPNDIKLFLKKTIFLIPTLQKTLKNKDDVIRNLLVEKIKTLETWNSISTSDIKNISLKKISNKKINIENESYILSKFLLPLPDYYLWKQKSVGYIDNLKNSIFLVSGDGVVFYFNYDQILEVLNSKNDKIVLSKLKTNIRELVSDNLFKPHKTSIKDILIKNNTLYISHINKKKDNCHNIEIISSEINFEFINFKDFFTYDECFINGELHSTGGRIVDYSKNEILFSIGEGQNRKLAQDVNSIFGKIIKINILTQEHKIISMGHRNPQGLNYDIKNNIIISTEHGPDGGDEINIIKNSDKISNYGWPISSYGNHYQGKINNYKNAGKLNELLEEAPLHKSHSKYSFVEPIKYFTSSIGISEVIKLPKSFKTNLKDHYVVGAMGKNIEEGDKSLHYFKLNKDNDKIESINKVLIGERIRDLKFIEKNDLIMLVLENTPSIGLLYLEN